MRYLVTALFTLAGLIKITPVIGVLGPERLQALYQLPIEGPDLLLLMRHRAVLFGAIGGLLLVAAFRPALRTVAATIGLISVASFLLLALPLHEHGAALQRVFWADVIVGLVLLLALALGRPYMRTHLRLILAVVAGIVIGSVVNMALIMVSGQVIPPPPGADMATAEGLKAAMPLLEPRHFVFPFLAHSLGTLVGAAVATFIEPGRGKRPALIVGVVFLVGGIAAVALIPAPLWFSVLDLLLAYLPAAWLGYRLASRITNRKAYSR